MKPTFKYTPDADVTVHPQGAIGLLCKPYQSHDMGLPEWVKNSSDEYLRRNTTSEDRSIIIFFAEAKTPTGMSIACLDCSGMTSEVIESRFRVWADPNASQSFSVQQVQGGHGNGGKCYMTQMFADYSELWTVSGGKRNRYGVSNGTVHFGYVPNVPHGRDVSISDVTAELANALDSIGINLSALPPTILPAVRRSGGFTLVIGSGPKGYKRTIPVTGLLEGLRDHPQMVQPIQLCSVYVVKNGVLIEEGKPLSLATIEPILGAESDRVIPIPQSLKDPLSQVKCETHAENMPAGTLVLRTSDKPMRGKKKFRNSIVYRTPGFGGFVPVSELDIQSTYRDRLYGECHLDSLAPFTQNERKGLAESPLTRAVNHFIAGAIQKYASEFDSKDRRAYNQQERDAVSKMNEMLDRWKNRFLHDLIRSGGDDDGPEPPPPLPIPAGTPVRLELTLDDARLGLGVSIRPKLRFYDRSGKRVRPTPFSWVSSDNNVAMVNEDLGILTSFAYGRTDVHAETSDGKLRSNSVSIEVVRITAVRLVPNTVEVHVGGRGRLNAICRLSDGTEASDVKLLWTENDSSIARVSSSGFVFGSSVGSTDVFAGDDKATSDPGTIAVVAADSKGSGSGNNGQGRGYPRVLISGQFDLDPDSNEQVKFSVEDPPIWQRPEDADRHIWWINSAAPLAALFLDSAKGYGFDSREWRMYHVERYIEVIVQVALKFGEAGQSTNTSIDEWILHSGSKAAEVQIAVAAELGAFIRSGEAIDN